MHDRAPLLGGCDDGNGWTTTPGDHRRPLLMLPLPGVELDGVSGLPCATWCVCAAGAGRAWSRAVVNSRLLVKPPSACAVWAPT